MNTQHTPGPWTLSESGAIKTVGGNFVPYGSPWMEDAYSDNDQTSESRANGSLMAAAPELLEALEDAEHQLRATWDGDNGATKVLISKIQSAIAKAKGETK